MAMRPVPRESAWPDEIFEDARTEYWSVIDVYIPGEATFNASAYTVAPGEPTYLIRSREARVQHVRTTLEQSGAYEWGAKRPYTIQTAIEPGDPFIPKGAVVKVVSAPRNPSLEKMTLQVISAVNSDHAAHWVISASTEFGQLEDSVEEPEEPEEPEGPPGDEEGGDDE